MTALMEDAHSSYGIGDGLGDGDGYGIGDGDGDGLGHGLGDGW